MSRIGKKLIPIPAGVDVQINGTHVEVKGPKGTLVLDVHPTTIISLETGEAGKEIHVQVSTPEENFGRAIWGTTRANLANLVKGVSEGFSKSLEVIGVGYKVNVQGQKVVLDVGYSHDVEVPLPAGVSATVEKNVLTLTAADKIVLGATAAKIRSIRKPEPYKGKGIKYTTEQIRRKAGKTAKSGE